MIQKLSTSYENAVGAISDQAESDTPGTSLIGRWIETVDELEALAPRWERLSSATFRPNLQLQSNFLIPAFQHLNDQQAKILVIEAPQIANPQGPSTLCGLIPLVARKFYKLPLRCYETWNHDQCFDSTPLIRKDRAFETLRFMFEFLKQEGTSLLSLDTVAAGEFGELLTKVVQEQKLGTFQRDQFSRAAFRPSPTFEEYMLTEVSKSVRKNVGRLERRLREQGELTVEVSTAESDFSELTRQFLELEASGWKRSEGTALACDPSTQAFFEQMVARSIEDNRVSFLGLKLDGKPIAMLCDLYSGKMGYSFKTAFDEQYSQYSPGLLVEIKNLEHMHRANVTHMDSCTDPNNATINRIWQDKIKFQSLVIGLNHGLPKMATRLMPLIQSAGQAAKKILNR